MFSSNHGWEHLLASVLGLPNMMHGRDIDGSFFGVRYIDSSRSSTRDQSQAVEQNMYLFLAMGAEMLMQFERSITIWVNTDAPEASMTPIWRTWVSDRMDRSRKGHVHFRCRHCWLESASHPSLLCRDASSYGDFRIGRETTNCWPHRASSSPGPLTSPGKRWSVHGCTGRRAFQEKSKTVKKTKMLCFEACIVFVEVFVF